MKLASIRRIAFASLCLAAACAGGGCGSNRLETGYQYTPLGSTSTQRRAFYAGPFSPEARRAQMSPDGQFNGTERNRPGM